MKKQYRLDKGILERYFLAGVLDKIQLKNFSALPLMVTPSEKDSVWGTWTDYIVANGGKVYNPKHLLFRECVVWCNNHYCRYHQLDDKTFMIGMPLTTRYLIVTVRIVDGQLNLIRFRHRKAGSREWVVVENGKLKQLLIDSKSGSNPYATKLIDSLMYMVGTVYNALHLIYVFNQEQKFLMVQLRNLKNDSLTQDDESGPTVLSMMGLPDADGVIPKSVPPHWVTGHHKTLRDIRFINHDKFLIEGGIFVPDYYVGPKECISDGKVYTVIDLNDKLTSLTM